MTMQEILDNILHAVFGREVRQSLHDGVKRANDICDDTEGRQTELERKYDLLLRNCTELSPSDAEIVDARIQEDGMAYETLGERLNAMDVSDKEVSDARVKEDGMAYETLGERLNAMDVSDKEVSDARVKEDGMAYETLGERLNELDNTLGEKVSSKLFDELSESVIELNELLERYLPRTSNLTMEVDTSLGSNKSPNYFIDDEFVTQNARVLALYIKGIGIAFPDGTILDGAEKTDIPQMITYVKGNGIYFQSLKEMENFAPDLEVVYVRDILRE